MDHRQHANIALSIVLAIEPRDGEEVRELPDEHDGKEDERFGFEFSAGSRPAEHYRHCTGKRAHECADGRNFLERSVGSQIDEGGQEYQ